MVEPSTPALPSPQPLASDQAQAQTNTACPQAQTNTAWPRAKATRWQLAALIAILLGHGALALWMAVAHPGPTQYFYDEKFNMENVERMVQTGSLTPANGWYSMASYLPQTALIAGAHRLHAATGTEWLRMIDAEGAATRSAFLIARCVGIVYGSLSIWLLFLLGKRLFSPGVGVLAALVLAASPWQIRTSVEFKPDSLLLTTTLLAFLALLGLLEHKTRGRMALAGLGYGLSLTAKLNGSFFGPTIALATAFAAWPTAHEPKSESGPWRIWLRRVLAWGSLEMVLAAAVFFLLTPYLGLTWHYLTRMDRFYGQKGGATTPVDMVLSAGQDLVTQYFLGPWVCFFALVGAAFLIAAAWDRQVDPALRVARLLVLVFPTTYLALVALEMRYYKGNNMVQLLPFLALAAAWGLLYLFELPRGSAAPAPSAPWKKGLRTLAVAALSLQVSWQASHFSYLEHVPIDIHRLSEYMWQKLPLDMPRIILYEGEYEKMPLYDSPRWDKARSVSSVRWVGDLTQLPRTELDLADVLITRADAPYLRDPARVAALKDLQAAVPPADNLPFPARFLVQRGSSYHLVRHAWAMVDAADLSCQATAIATTFRCALPSTWQAGDVGAVHFSFPNKRIGVAQITLGAERLEALLSASWDGPGSGWEAVSERFVVPAPGAELELVFEKPIEGPLADQIQVSLSRWRAPQNVRLHLPAPFPSTVSAP